EKLTHNVLSVPADGVKGKTWGPSTAHQKERGHIIPQHHDNQKRWSKSAPNLEKSLRPLPYTATMTGLNQITAYGPEIDYSGEDGGWSAKPVPLRPLPVPTLYNGNTPETKGQQPKFSPLELLVYNIAAILASVAAGYDVRLSNVTAVHPRLLPVKSDDDADYQRWLGMNDYNEFSSPSGYAHNTYHGPTRHSRPALVLEPKPIRFTDSPQHFATGQAALPPSQQPPRRKSSSASNDSEVTSYGGGQRVHIPGPLDYLRPDYRSEQHLVIWGEREQPSQGPASQHVPPSPAPDAEIYRGEVYQQYPPEVRSDSAGYFHSDRGGYHGPPAEYLASVHYEQRVYPQYIMRHTAAAAAASSGEAGYHAYDNPSTSVSSSSTSTNPRTPSRLNFQHRRTPSSVSNASTSSSNINRSFRLEDEGDSSYSTPTHRSGHYDMHGGPAPPPRVSRQNSHELDRIDRPGSLDLPRHQRSSLRKYNYNYGRSSPKPRTDRSGSGGSGGGTPTNPTPPDSMTSEDSSYVSAPDIYSTQSGGSGGNSTGGSRVRFSPASHILGPEGVVGRHTLLDMPVEGQSQDTTVPLTALRQAIRHHEQQAALMSQPSSWTAFDGSDERL
ncbi:hypothetical protein SK128_023200, partial [Halocaridina rubra]